MDEHNIEGNENLEDIAQKERQERKKRSDPKPKQKEKDPFKALDDKLKFYMTELITLRKIREEQFSTIAELRSENFRLKKEVKQLKGE